MQGLGYWRLCDEVSVVQAALLIIGRDPSEVQEYIDNWSAESRPDGYDAVKAAIVHAILGKRLCATIRRRAWERGWDEEPTERERYVPSPSVIEDEDPWPDEAKALKSRGMIFRVEPDWGLTTVTIENLQIWLRGRGVKSGFFFPEGTGAPDYLDSSHPNYSPKLSAAVAAWQAITANLSLRGSGSVKQALTKWLAGTCLIGVRPSGWATGVGPRRAILTRILSFAG